MTDVNLVVYLICENISLLKNYIEQTMSGRRWMLEEIRTG